MPASRRSCLAIACSMRSKSNWRRNAKAGVGGGAMQNDPRLIIDDNPMNARQWIVVALMVALNALDGFDVLSSAFAAPGISREWGVPRDALGVVLSAELIGMGFGSVLLGGV